MCTHAGTNSFPWIFVLCSLQGWMYLVRLPDLTHSRTLSRPLQWGFKCFCACFNPFRHVRQVSAVEVPANYTIWLPQWARREADCRERENPDVKGRKGTHHYPFAEECFKIVPNNLAVKVYLFHFILLTKSEKCEGIFFGMNSVRWKIISSLMVMPWIMPGNILYGRICGFPGLGLWG